jgi:hypothetical protein
MIICCPIIFLFKNKVSACRRGYWNIIHFDSPLTSKILSKNNYYVNLSTVSNNTNCLNKFFIISHSGTIKDILDDIKYILE